jgi:hypothetical protein
MARFFDVVRYASFAVKPPTPGPARSERSTESEINLTD